MVIFNSKLLTSPGRVNATGSVSSNVRLRGDAKAQKVQEVIGDLKSRLEDVQADAGWQCFKGSKTGEISGKMWEIPSFIVYIWLNYSDLTVTSLESWLVRGIIPKWP